MRAGSPGSIGIKRIQWSKPVPSWKRAEAWRAKHRAMRESAQGISNAMTNAVIGAQANLVSARAEHAVKAAIDRVRQQALAKLDKQADETAKRLEKIQTDLSV
jgi:hypothetical protein